MNLDHEYARPQNSIMRMDVDSFATVPTGGIYPSFNSISKVSSNFTFGYKFVTVGAVDSGIFSELEIGAIVSFVDTENEGYYIVTGFDNNKDTIYVDPISGQTMVPEVNYDEVLFSSNDLAKKYRAFSFNVDVTLTFNNNPAFTYMLPAYEVLFYNRSMRSFDVDVPATIVWSY